MSEGCKTIIISVLLNSIIKAERDNDGGINNEYIKACRDALKEIKSMSM